MKKFFNKLVSRSFWGLLAMFFAILFAILMVGDKIAAGYAGWINSFLGIDPYIRVDDSETILPTFCITSPILCNTAGTGTKRLRNMNSSRGGTKKGFITTSKGLPPR